MLAWVAPEKLHALLDPLPAGVEAVALPGDPAGDERVAEVEFLLAGVGTASFEGALGAMRALRAIQVVSAGTDWIEDVVPDGVTLCNARGVRDDAVADWCAAALLFDAQDLGRAERQRAAHAFDRWQPRELAGQRVLIVGHGSIGRALRLRLAALGCGVTAVARHARPGVHAIDELDDLLPHADAVVILTPLTDATRGLVDAAFLAALPDGALVVNAGRGECLDTGALLAELRTGRLRAALDVVDPEPLPADHELWDAPGLLLTPHVAGDSEQAYAGAARFARAQLGRAARGEPLLNAVRSRGDARR